jgi:exosome complex RNA-binding protein Rrp4
MNSEQEKIYINIPYKIKDEGKKLGAFYDIDKKSWYILDKEKYDLFKFVEVNIPYNLRFVANENGCIWIKDKKAWVTCNFNLDNISKIMNDPKINELTNIKKDLLNKPNIKLLNDINKLESIDKNYNSNKMIFTRW